MPQRLILSIVALLDAANQQFSRDFAATKSACDSDGSKQVGKQSGNHLLTGGSRRDSRNETREQSKQAR